MKKEFVKALEPVDTTRFDTAFNVIAYGLLVIIIIFSTYLHHCRPEVLRVPNNKDVASWKMPSFEETAIYGRMTEEQKAKILKEGVPHTSMLDMCIQDLIMIPLLFIPFFHCRKYYGSWMASCFLIGSFVFTGAEESLWILTGRFAILPGTVNLFGDYVTGTYWFTRGGLWFFETPVMVCLGWFALAYSCVWSAGKMFPNMRLWGIALIGGFTAMGIDLWIDPVETSPEFMNWVWGKGDIIMLLGIPHSNFVGWFLLIFVFALIWEWLIGWEKRWGRGKTTIFFVVTLVVLDICVYLFQIPWAKYVGFLLYKAFGVDHILLLPPGW